MFPTSTCPGIECPPCFVHWKPAQPATAPRDLKGLFAVPWRFRHPVTNSSKSTNPLLSASSNLAALRRSRWSKISNHFESCETLNHWKKQPTKKKQHTKYYMAILSKKHDLGFQSMSHLADLGSELGSNLWGQQTPPGWWSNTLLWWNIQLCTAIPCYTHSYLRVLRHISDILRPFWGLFSRK